MCRRLGKDLSDEMVSRPRQLKRRHDEAVEEIRQQEILDNIAQNREAWEKKAQEMAGKYPGAEDNLAAVRKIYEYTGEEYMVARPPQAGGHRGGRKCAASLRRLFGPVF